MRHILESARAKSSALGIRAFVAGGFVRDRQLGRETRDLDLLVEGQSEAAAFARALARELGAGLVEHPTFSSYSLVGLEGLSIDITTARREVYSAPAALPRVEPATIEEDLGRRDFSINAMAVPLAGDGALLDLFGGREHLAEGRLRVLHRASFEDDPTRALRAVRFELRLGFELDADSRRWLARAIEDGAFARLSPDRLRAEMRLTLGTAEWAVRALDRLSQLGLLTEVLPGVAWSASVRAELEGVVSAWQEATEEEGDEGGELSAAILAALAAGLERSAISQLAERLAVTPATARAWSSLAERLDGARAVVADRDAATSAIVSAVGALSAVERRVLIPKLDPSALGRMRAALDAERSLDLTVDGRALLAAGVAEGRAVGAALEALRRARLDGECNAGEELDFALAVARAQGGEGGVA